MIKAPTAKEIARMKARGDDRTTVGRAEELLARYEEVILPLRTEIRTAFADVRLGDGVGLRQARALDDHWDDAVALRARAEDETQDWSALSDETLLHYGDTLSFFDAEGMRFHLPAFLLAETNGNSGSLVFHLTYQDDQPAAVDYRLGKFRLLNAAQRQVVRAFLLAALEDEDYAYERDNIARALAGYWSEPT